MFLRYQLNDDEEITYNNNIADGPDNLWPGTE